MLYFAYGSNLHSAQMKERCPSATFVCRAKLPAHRLAFTLKSLERRCGVADVLYDKEKDVWGVVYEVSENELRDLDKDESFQPGRPDDQNAYTRENHYVWPEGDIKRALLVWLYRGHPQLDPPLPSYDYKRLIVEGARHWKLPVEYIRELETIQTAL
jgi:gamma-glutamylcyclotransferase